jgi:hypothetical protein
MSETKASPPGRGTPPEDEGVLANLPRTRPQRSSPRRAAARKVTAAQASAAPTPASPRKRSEPSPAKQASARTPPGKRTRSAAKRTGASAPLREPSPRQGFECDGEPMTGSVPPPGGADLLVSAAELVGELAKASVSSGERLLKDVFSRLRPS